MIFGGMKLEKYCNGEIYNLDIDKKRVKRMLAYVEREIKDQETRLKKQFRRTSHIDTTNLFAVSVRSFIKKRIRFELTS